MLALTSLEIHTPEETIPHGVLLLSGEKSPGLFHIITDMAHSAIPGSEMRTIPSADHSIHTSAPAAYSEAAWEFIKCATGAEAQASWARDTQAQPTNLQAATDPVLLARQHHERAYIREVVQQFASRTAIVPWLSEAPVGAEPLQAVVRGAADADGRKNAI